MFHKPELGAGNTKKNKKLYPEKGKPRGLAIDEKL